ncbi:hypothetical protein QQP08_008012 [Theobroma cacao]|nr:hypothetical protein QQP08_008012 [Theobroma cacao]
MLVSFVALMACIVSSLTKVKGKELLESGETGYLGCIVQELASLLVPAARSSDLLVLSFNVYQQPAIVILFIDTWTALSTHVLCQSSLLAARSKTEAARVKAPQEAYKEL